MHPIRPLLTVALLATCAQAAAEPVANQRAKLEADYQADVAVCKELTKSETPACLKEALAAKKAAYAQAWAKRDPASQSRTYSGDLNANKPKIEKDYQADAAFCKELAKADAATCQREALARKKLAIKSVMAAPKASVPASAKTSKATCPSCGVVTGIREVEKPGEGSLLGQIGGGVVGGALGNQIGGGKGRTVATIAGVVGGALVGNEIEKRVKTSRYHEVSFRLESGEEKTIAFDSAQHGFHGGDKIRFENNQLSHRQ